MNKQQVRHTNKCVVFIKQKSVVDLISEQELLKDWKF